MYIMNDIKFLDLTADNAFDFCIVLDAIGMETITTVVNKEEILALQKAGKDTKSIGLIIAMRIANIIVKKLPSAREPIYSFFSGCCVWGNSGKAVTVDELKNLKLSAFLKLMKDFFSKDNLVDFLEEAGLSFNAAPGEESTATATDNGDMTTTVPAAAQ